MPITKRDGVYTRSDRDGYWISYIDHTGRRRQRKTKAHSLAQARMILSAELLRVDQARTLGYVAPANDLFSDLVTRYLRYQKARIGSASYLRLKSIIDLHLTPHFSCSLASIKRADVQRFVTVRAEAAAPATVAKELSTLRHMLSLAVDWELLAVNPSNGVKPPKIPPGRVRYLQPSELRDMIKAATEWLRPIIAIAVLTGMRRGEILGVRWSDIELSACRLILRRTKNNSVRMVYLNQSAIAVLRTLEAGNPCDPVFPVRGDWVSLAFRRLCAQLKITDFHFHDLRHTAASWLRMSGADSHTVGEILGHRDPRMAARYQHLSPVFLADAVGKLDGVFGLLEAGKFGSQRDHRVTESEQQESPVLESVANHDQ